jgi:hypothetical protein
VKKIKQAPPEEGAILAGGPSGHRTSLRQLRQAHPVNSDRFEWGSSKGERRHSNVPDPLLSQEGVGGGMAPF